MSGPTRVALRRALAREASLQARVVSPSRPFLTRTAYGMAKKMMPKISETERTALGAGTIGFDREIFTGNPSLQGLLETYQVRLSEEEKQFLDNECHQLCAMIDDHTVVQNADFSPEVWDYMRRSGFFSLKIPKEWGGKGFSTAAVSAVLSKLSSRSSDASATVAVPNSLGPGELLVRYGTPAQQQYFLPRLASGQLIPCFGLTGPQSGSDATSLIGSYGTVEERNGELGVVATFRKRYITLAPVAGVVGVGLDLRDPNGLLKGHGGEGFTVALLERDHDGLRMGPRHVPLTAAFMNGTVEGDDVWIPMSSMLGGQEQCGRGWHMFVECLAEGRGVSLPAGSVAAARTLNTAVGAYSRIRKQFKVPIAEFGGIQEALARMGGQGLVCVAGTDLMNAIVDNHEAPMVISSIMKQSCTERGRRIVVDGMDIMAGAGIVRGESNFVGNMYTAMPIAITVEGANIMTRSFQIMGQGITRCHPHMVPLIDSLESDAEDAPAKFRAQFFNMLGHVFANFGRSVVRGIGSAVATATRSNDAYELGNNLVSHHEDQLLRLSANLAFAADLSLLCGGRLKFEELLLGRLADCMSAIYLGYAVLWHYEQRQGIQGLEAVTEHAMLMLENEAQEALKEAAVNFPAPLGQLGGMLLSLGVSPLGGFTRNYHQPKDDLTKEVARLLTTPSGVRDLFKEHVFVAGTEGDRVTALINALPVVVEADAIQAQLRKAKRDPTPEESQTLALATSLRDAMAAVDVFDKHGPLEQQPGYVRPAILQTEQWSDASPAKAAVA